MPQVLAPILLTACQGPQSMFGSAGPESVSVMALWWILLGISCFVFFVVCLFLFLPLLRKSDSQLKDSDLNSWFFGGIIATVLILVGIVVTTFQFSSDFVSLKKEPIEIEVVGKRWWWEVIYYDEKGDILFKTANEIHIPVGRPVHFRLSTDNVIHSFWVPSLGGKADMVPGRNNYLWLQADREGTFRGQCAEYCGLQHTFMAFEVIAEKSSDYQKWKVAQALKARTPETPVAKRGFKVFREAACFGCHTVRGSFEVSELGPDLTHLMSRKWIAARTLPNTQGHLSGWVANPDGSKPGALMPGVKLPVREYRDLMYYLRTLK